MDGSSDALWFIALAGLVSALGVIYTSRHNARHERNEARRVRLVDAADSFAEAANAFIGYASAAATSMTRSPQDGEVEAAVAVAREAGNLARTRLSRVQLNFGPDSRVATSAEELLKTFWLLQLTLEGGQPGSADHLFTEAGDGIDVFVGEAHSAVIADEHGVAPEPDTGVEP